MNKSLLTLAVFVSVLATSRAAELKVKSPDGHVVVTVTDKDNLAYSVSLNGQEIVSKSRLGIIADGVDLGADTKLGKSTSHTIRESAPVLGVHAEALNNCRETTVSVRTGAGETYDLDVRAYNDGVALRSRLAAKPGRKINGEATEWKMAGNPLAWFQTDFGSYEGIFQSNTLNNLSATNGIPLPITFSLDKGGYALITEANLVNYSDLGVQPTAEHSLHAFFHADRNGWSNDEQVIQPWRVTLVARDLNTLVNSDLIRNLCPSPSPELAKADWIQPGRSTWQWWSSGGPKYAEQHQWVDWTQQLGFEYYLIDEGWKTWPQNWAGLKEVCDYAKGHNVKIWAWVNSSDVNTSAKLTDFLDRSVAAGVVGVKIDFEPQANVRWVNWYDEALQDAAARKLMLDFHGANKPIGREKTWPNEITRESIRGHEYHISRYRRTMPLPHDTILPFTRFVIGPGDYTPTVFNPRELRGFTWSRELAEAIVFTSPFLCYADHPTNYLSNPAVDVMKAIPATWDETVVLPGSEIGKCAAFARRTGKNWFIGVINGGESSKLDFALDFLPKGKFHVIQLGDEKDQANAWVRTESDVKRGDTMQLNIRSGGGCVMEITPL